MTSPGPTERDKLVPAPAPAPAPRGAAAAGPRSAPRDHRGREGEAVRAGVVLGVLAAAAVMIRRRLRAPKPPRWR